MAGTPKRTNSVPTPGSRFLSQVAGGNVRAVRSLRCLNQDALAEAMRSAGHPTWSRATVSEVERNGRNLTIDELGGLALVLDCWIVDLLDPAGPDGRSRHSVDLGAGLVLPVEVASGWIRGQVGLSGSAAGTVAVEPRGDDPSGAFEAIGAMRAARSSALPKEEQP